MRFQPAKPSLFGETLESLTEAVKAAGYPGFRAKQVMEWLYKKRVGTWDAMTNLPKAFRGWLDETYILYPTQPLLDKRSDDVTQKFLLELEDKSLIETVLIRAPQTGVGQEKSRKTVCVSIQVGCAYGCKFCASGLAGFRRNLGPAEVVSQLMHICRMEDAHTERAKDEIASFDNIVFMGMGEPLANYDTLVRTIKILNAEWGLNFGARRITVSTSGVAPKIKQLAEEGVAVRLAISLHGATNEVRNKIMPVNKRYPLEELIPAAKAFKERHGRMLTLEFIMIEDINDSIDQARELAKIAKDLHAHVNCIPYNKVEGLEWVRPSVRKQDAFVDYLRKAGVSVTIRREKGHDINAACGQLRLKTEKQMAEAEAKPSNPFQKPADTE
ncbi:23S rRNA (adenine(2503)-C(2))-methyltransferase RlmN [Coraliomargarita akajimensis]|uniref:Probable dual-specificity RNA methyltransferase RlmN n=1 Tax=Coraliomargarita akajimensis (strain DSM 45221 / IAM 15411 / JCM 23193 / KCTC 12865 / 04OKA010-24) TaxID=583355 RepID=D5EQU2_CORAD|nr:23S rRNA (adenine(2503)-C(2))-methyltransferase RlmN [Coraliomargarita akajimensis]ADE53935.1 radical SAM enzyme, Cfr family [Coraliomargarita akajimensis DSM 45221]